MAWCLLVFWLPFIILFIAYVIQIIFLRMQFDEDEIGDMGFLGCCAPILRTLCCSPCSGKYYTVIFATLYGSARGIKQEHIKL